MRYTNTTTMRRWGASLCVMVCLLVAGGCSDKDSSVDVVTLEGKVDKIERTTATTGTLTVLYRSEKHGQDMVGIGEITSETEILIDGTLATLADVREGERIRGEVRIDKVNGQERKTVMKLHIERAKPIGISPETKP